MKPERINKEILNVAANEFVRDTQIFGPANYIKGESFIAGARWMEEYRQSSPVESKWVKVSERLPEDYGLVLIVMTSGARTVGRRLRTNNWGIFTSTGIDSESQTNRVEMWQPLPELPIEEPKEK